jgi:hypothetical protein
VIKDLLSLMSPTRWAVLGAVLLALLGGATIVHTRSLSEAREQGRAETRAAWLAAENRALLNLAERAATLSNELTEALSAYSTVATHLSGARADADRRGQRVRSAAAPSGDLAARLGAAECSVARAFAADAFRTAAACRDTVADLGLGTGGLVESSASAHAEHARADALMRFAMPRSPFQPDHKGPTP